MFDFVSAALAVPAVSVANVKFNTEEIIKKIDEAAGSKADFVVFPELCVTGYSCADLFLQNALLDGAISGIEKIAAVSQKVKKIIIVGAPLRISGQLYNCAVVIFNGEIKGIVAKTYIPDYADTSEKRYFSSASDLEKKEYCPKALGFMWQDSFIPVGNDLVFVLRGGLRFGVEICEDMFAPVSQGTLLSLGGAQVIFNIAANIACAGKREALMATVAQQSLKNICSYYYVSAGCSESTTDVVFSGCCLAAEEGRITAKSEELLSDNQIIYADSDVGKIKHIRLKNKTFKDSFALIAKNYPVREIFISGTDLFKSEGENYKIEALPFIPSEKEKRVEFCSEVFEIQTAGLLKCLKTTNTKAVLGVSGGLDSTLALLVCAYAMKKSGRPLSDVVGITLPCFGTSDRTYNNAHELMKTLGITSEEINIKAAVLKHFEDIGHEADCYDLTFENSQARERTQVLMDYAGMCSGLVVGTGDLSELMLGWCTYNADHMSMYSVNGSIPKTLIRWIIESVIEKNIFPESEAVLRDIMDTPISPELLPPDAMGKISQETESLVGPYALHDFFIYYTLSYGFSPDKIYFLAKKAFEGRFDSETILKWLKIFYRRFLTQQFKRSCSPDGVKATAFSVSPRGDLKLPSDASFALWLEMAENL